MDKHNKYHSKEDALKKLMRYCAYQDRCHREVTGKLLDLGIYGEALDDIVITLIREGFLNEERFAKSYARGKFYYKNWGRKKIVQELKKRDISPYLIRAALREIDPDDYHRILMKLAGKHLKGSTDFRQRVKTFKYLYQKGYEAEVIHRVLDILLGGADGGFDSR